MKPHINKTASLYIEKYFTVYSIEPKIRLGADKDGGYVIADIPNPEYDCYISAGVSNDESFSRDFLRRYNIPEADCYAFDGTIEDYPWEFTKNIQFFKKNISNRENENVTDLKTIAKKYKNIFLKMDIENSEYCWINSMETELLQNFKQIVIEYHGINSDHRRASHDVKVSCFEKMANTHYIVHAHGNNGGTATVFNDIIVPDIMEITYVRKDAFYEKPRLNKTKLPCVLDKPNNPRKPDYNLNFYPFTNFYNNVHINNMVTALLVSVNYSDYLEVTLPFNTKQFDEIIVLTIESDKECQDLCSKYSNVKCLVFPDEILKKNGKKFNKGAIVNKGFEYLNKIGYSDWLVITDSDIVFPENFKELLISKEKDPSVFYGMTRRHSRKYQIFKRYIRTKNKEHLRIISTGEAFVGFCQIFIYQSRTLRYDEHQNADISDILFLLEFSRKCNLKLDTSAKLSLLSKDDFVVHLGEKNKNWTGRVTPKFT